MHQQILMNWLRINHILTGQYQDEDIMEQKFQYGIVRSCSEPYIPEPGKYYQVHGLMQCPISK